MVEKSMDIHIPEFDDLTGNWLCLDFTHTLEDRFNADRKELLHTYSDLLAWGLYTRLLQEEEAQELLHTAEQHPQKADKTLRDALNLREAIYRIFYNISQEETPDADDMALFNAAFAQAMSHAAIVGTGEKDHFRWDWQIKGDADRLERINWIIIRSAADLLASEKLRDVRACAADDCRWLFLDISKNHSRHWCDMETCGNKAKARRHYSRKKSGSLHA